MSNFKTCPICGHRAEDGFFFDVDGKEICGYCYQNDIQSCENCGKQTMREKGNPYCRDCYWEWLDGQDRAARKAWEDRKAENWEIFGTSDD